MSHLCTNCRHFLRGLLKSGDCKKSWQGFEKSSLALLAWLMDFPDFPYLSGNLVFMHVQGGKRLIFASEASYVFVIVTLKKSLTVQKLRFFFKPLDNFCSLIFSPIVWWWSSNSFSLGEDTGSRKRFQRVEILKIAEPCPLIDPSQVVVTQGEIMVADPVLSPIGNNSILQLFLISECMQS